MNLRKQIEHYKLEIDAPDWQGEDLGEADEEWAAFPNKKGGYWGYGNTLEKAIKDCLKNNKFKEIK